MALLYGWKPRYFNIGATSTLTTRARWRDCHPKKGDSKVCCAKIKNKQPKTRPMKTRQRTQPLRLTKQGKPRNKTKARQCLVYKLNRRSTEAALIYSAICKAKAFRRLSGPLQTPSIVYKTNKNKPDGPQWSRQFVDEVNPLCGQRRSLLAQQGSSNKHTML